MLTRLEPFGLRVNGRDRWRAMCPVCGERNPNTLSIGIGFADAVLVKCFKSSCEVEAIVSALQLELTDLFPQGPVGAAPTGRRRMLTATQALELLFEEICLARHCAYELSQGILIDAQTRERLLLGAARVTMMRDEVRS